MNNNERVNFSKTKTNDLATQTINCVSMQFKTLKARNLFPILSLRYCFRLKTWSLFSSFFFIAVNFIQKMIKKKMSTEKILHIKIVLEFIFLMRDARMELDDECDWWSMIRSLNICLLMEFSSAAKQIRICEKRKQFFWGFVTRDVLEDLSVC